MGAEAQGRKRGRRWRRRPGAAFALGVANGMLWNFASAFVHDSTVLPAFVREAGGGTLLVGLLPVIGVVCWNLPQLLAANRLQAARHYMPMYRAAALVRATAWPAAAAATYWLGGGSKALLLAVFLLAYAVFMTSGGIGTTAFTAVVARVVPATRLGLFFGLRQLGGGLLGAAGGAIVWGVLREAKGSVENYALLFACASGIFAACWVSFALIAEPEPAPTKPREPMGRFVVQAALLLRSDRDFARFFLVRIVQSAALMAVPFYVVFCREVLGVPRQTVGVYLFAQMLGMIVSNVAWAPLSDRAGNRLVLRLLAADIVLATGLAAALPLWGSPAAGRWFPAVFFLLGTLSSGAVIGNTNYLLEMAPVVETPLYVAAMNALTATGAVFSVIAGGLVGVVGYHSVFAAAALFAVAALAASGRLREPRSLG